MALLHPSDFKHVPGVFRPRRTVKVSHKFAKEVRKIAKLGGRSNSEDVGEVMMVLNNMRMRTPKVFLEKQKNNKRKTFKRSK
jgi:mRNA-degrading endonuclease YafQ of YafQ-DinJ toxin-antitoxin module